MPTGRPNYWVGPAGGDFTDPANWSLQEHPQANQDLYFDGSQSNGGVTFFKGTKVINGVAVEFRDRYYGIHLVSGYTGTVTLPFNITFGDYEQTTGATAHTAAGQSVTVTGGLNWTGGNVNDTAYAGLFRFKGVGSGIVGTATSTLSSGSKLYLETNTAGAGASILAKGIVNLLNQVGVEVNAACQMQLGVVGGTGPTITSQGVYVNKGQTYSHGGKLLGLGMEIDGGDLQVKGGGLKVTGTAPGSVYSVRMLSGLINILNGQTLEATHGVTMLDGDLVTAGSPTGNQVATIDGMLHISDGRIILGSGNNPGYATLKVKKKVELFGGTFQTKVDATDSQNRDAIDTDDTLNCSTNFVISPQAINGNPPVDMSWSVLVSEDGFIDAINPSVSDPIAWGVARSNNGKNLDVVKK